MNKNIYCFFFCYLIIQVLSVVPEWDLTKAGQNILGSNTEITIEIERRVLYNVEMIMKKRLTKTDEGIKVTNLLTIAGKEEEVDFDQVESFYYLFNIYIVCPKGSYHPYNFSDKKEIKPDEKFSGENWDLKCFKHVRSNYFLVFYLMNGNNINMYLTNMDNINWYGGASIEKDNIKETYDFLLKDEKNPGYNTYQMLAILNEENNIRLVNLAYFLEQGDDKQYVKSYVRQGIIEKRIHTQAYFKNKGDERYFYYLTYNDINDFKTGYSTSPIKISDDYYNIIGKVHIKFNDNPHFEFFDNMEIKKMKFLSYNKFLYYEMKSLNNNDKYYGIFDVELNKIIFNTKEEITQFIPYNRMSILAVTKEKAYKICAYNSNNDCIDTCENNDKFILDIEGNKCGQGCSDGKLTFIPLEVCINKCNEDYYVISDNKCGLCKDMNSTHPYKLIGGTECLEKIIKSSYIYNENLKLLKCNEGYHLENNECIRDIPCYELCLDCIESSNNETDQKCTGCIDGFNHDKNNNCICPKGKEKKDKQCFNCSNGCGTYKINKCDCESCSDQYFLKDSKCEKCDSSCLKCETESTKCTECNNTFSFLENNKCYNCTDCKENDTESCRCLSCKDGYYLENHQCKKCGNDCKACSNANKCLICEQSYSLENGECKKCSMIPSCNSTEENSCKCASCNQNYYLHDNECIECNDEIKCKTYEDNEKCKCKICNTGYYIDNNDFFCEKCSDNCETCDGGKIDDMNHHCLSCKKDSENKFLINKDNKHICVSNCSLYNGTNNLEKNICEFQESKENPEKRESSVDYALIIVVCVVGVILIIISACICKKFICQKNEPESIEEIEEGELIDK